MFEDLMEKATTTALEKRGQMVNFAISEKDFLNTKINFSASGMNPKNVAEAFFAFRKIMKELVEKEVE
jgi:hypothetical protein